MRGTEKQIAWANEIKSRSMSAWSAMAAEYEANGDDRHAAIRTIADLAGQSDDAETWIDGRDSVSVHLHSMGHDRVAMSAMVGIPGRLYLSLINAMQSAR